MIIADHVWERMMRSAEEALREVQMKKDRVSIYQADLDEYIAVRRAMLVAYKRARHLKWVPDPLARQIEIHAEHFANFPVYNREWLP